MDIQGKFAKIIEATGHPLAPIILQEAYVRVDALGRLMADANADKVKVESIKNSLLIDWPENELDELAGTPEFIIALCACLCQAMLHYARKL